MVSIPNRDFDELQFYGLSFRSVAQVFQSLIGILMNCNTRWFIYFISERHVSIPNRDFDELQCCQGAQYQKGKVSIPNRDFDELQSGRAYPVGSGRCVSIPNRDFDELQLASVYYPAKLFVAFQSLIGILMNCNLVFIVTSAVISFNP